MALALSACPPPPLRSRRGASCSIFFAQRAAKRNLLELISKEDRGVRTQKDATKRDAIVNAIESMAVIGRNSITTSDSLSATWRLLWTTEKEQLFIIEKAGLFGTSAGDVLQVIDVQKRILNNVITFPPDGVFFVRSDIQIASPQRVNFRFISLFVFLQISLSLIDCILIFRFNSAVLRGKNWELPLPPFGKGW